MFTGLMLGGTDLRVPTLATIQTDSGESVTGQALEG